MPAFNDGFLDVPARPGKPRETGLTHVMDKGLNLRDIEGMFDVGGDFVQLRTDEPPVAALAGYLAARKERTR